MLLYVGVSSAYECEEAFKVGIHYAKEQISERAPGESYYFRCQVTAAANWCIYILVDGSLFRIRTIEEAFFKKHDTFKHQDPQLFGISNLAKKLTYLLVARIKQELVCVVSIYDCVWRCYVDVARQASADLHVLCDVCTL